MRNAASAGPASHAIASDTRSGGRSDPTGRVLVRLHPLAGRSGVGGHRSPTKAAATRRRVLVRLADALGGRVSCASWSSSLPIPLFESARTESGLEPPRGHQIGTRSPGRWSNARKTTSPAPQSKPVTPRLVAHVAPSVTSGLGLRILAAGPACHPHYSCRGRLCEQSLLVGARSDTLGCGRKRQPSDKPLGRSQLVLCGPVRGAGERACLWRFPGFDPPLVSSCLDADAMRRAGLPRNALGLMLRPQADSSRMLRFFTSNSVSIRFRVRRISRPRCARARRGSRAIPRAGRRGARP